MRTVKSLNNAVYLSFLNCNVDPNLMSDANHLNSRGAMIFSGIINDMINEHKEEVGLNLLSL